MKHMYCGRLIMQLFTFFLIPSATYNMSFAKSSLCTQTSIIESIVEDIDSKIGDCTLCDELSIIDSKIDALSPSGCPVCAELSVIESFVENIDNNIGDCTICETISIIDSKIDALDVCDLCDQVSVIESFVEDIDSSIGDCTICDELSIIDSKIDILTGECSLMPVPDDGIIIEPGSYCLGSNFGSTITIGASNVTLDLNGYTIAPFSGDGIDVNSGISNFYIKNGLIVSPANGIFISDGCSNFTISDMEIESATTGITMIKMINGISDFLIKNCTVINAGARGFLAETCKNFVIDNCIAVNCGIEELPFPAFDLSLSASAVIRNCVAQNNFSIGFFLENALYISVNSCTSQCNSGNGFDLVSSTSCQIKSCSALNNTGIGFVDALGNNNLYINNSALFNSFGDYLNVTHAPVVASTDSGISFWNNITY